MRQYGEISRHDNRDSIALKQINGVKKMDQITDKEWRELAKLGKDIIICLRQDLNGDGVPPRTDRFEALKLMQKYLAIHGINTD